MHTSITTIDMQNYPTHITKGKGFYPSVHLIYPISINATHVQ